MSEIFKENVICNNKTNVLYLKKDTGVKSVEGDQDCFKIILSDWTLGVVDKWIVSYRNIIFDKSLGKRKLKVFYARTTERLIKYCEEFGCIFPEVGILNLAINGLRKIDLSLSKNYCSQGETSWANILF